MNKRSFFNYFILICSLILFFSSCKSRSQLSQNTSSEIVVDYKFKDIKQILNVDHADFNTLDAKLKLNIDLEQKMSAKATLRMKKDESVWMSVSYFGVEVARMLMDEKKISVLDKINKKHYTLDYASWNQKYGTEFTISHFQKLLLGQPVESINRQFDWSQKNGIVDINNQESSKHLYWLFYQLNQTALTNQTIVTKDQQLQCLYSVRRINNTMPEQVNVDLNLNKKVKVKISTNKVELNKSIKMPFKVSSKYENIVL